MTRIEPNKISVVSHIADSVTPRKSQKQWTVLCYMNGNNNLSENMKVGFNYLLKTGSDENVNIVSQLAVKGEPVKRGLVEKNRLTNTQTLGTQDMGSHTTLQNFIEWAVENYPAENYLLLLSGHGGGFTGSMPDDLTGNNISNRELSDVLKTIRTKIGRKIDVVNFIACYMNQLETLEELKKETDFVVGSETIQNNINFLIYSEPLRRIADSIKKGIKEKGRITPKELSKLIVYESKYQMLGGVLTPTMSAVEISKVDDITRLTDELAKLFLGEIKRDSNTVELIRNDILKTRHVGLNRKVKPKIDYCDLGDFAKIISLSNNYKNPVIKETALNIIKSIENAVIAEQHGVNTFFPNYKLSGSKGISIYLPIDFGNSLDEDKTYNYEKTALSQNTQWSVLLKAIAASKTVFPEIETQFQAVIKLMISAGIFTNYILLLENILFSMLPKQIDTKIFPLISVINGIFKTKDGVSAIAEAPKQDDIKDKSRLVSKGISNMATGISSVAVGGALACGALNIAVPAAAVIVGKPILDMAAEIIKSRQSASLPVSEKLAIIDEDQRKDLKDMPFMNKCNFIIRQITGVDIKRLLPSWKLKANPSTSTETLPASG